MLNNDDEHDEHDDDNNYENDNVGDAFSLACSPPVAEVDVITNNLRFQSLLPKISPSGITMIMTKIIMMTMVVTKIQIAKKSN